MGLFAFVKNNDFYDSLEVSLLHEPSITSPLSGSLGSINHWGTYTLPISEFLLSQSGRVITASVTDLTFLGSRWNDLLNTLQWFASR